MIIVNWLFINIGLIFLFIGTCFLFMSIIAKSAKHDKMSVFCSLMCIGYTIAGLYPLINC